MNAKTSIIAAFAALLMSIVTVGTAVAPATAVASTTISASAHA